MRGFFHGGRWYEDTGMVCRRCRHPVYRSDLAEYTYQCFHCDEDLYSFEAIEPDGSYMPPIMVARPVGGITLNEGLEYLLDDGETRIFAGWREAETYLLGHGVAKADLEMVYFVEADEEYYDEG